MEAIADFTNAITSTIESTASYDNLQDLELVEVVQDEKKSDIDESLFHKNEEVDQDPLHSPQATRSDPLLSPQATWSNPSWRIAGGGYHIHIISDLDPSGYWMRNFVDVTDYGGLDDMVGKASSSSTTPRVSSRARECLSRSVCLFSQFSHLAVLVRQTRGNP